MTTCLDCGFRHIMNYFTVGFDEDDLAIFECPHCGSDNCVRNTDVPDNIETDSPDEVDGDIWTGEIETEE